MQTAPKYPRFPFVVFSVYVSFCCALVAQNQRSPYHPERHPEWQHRAPQEVGLRADAVQEAIAFAQSHETKSPRSLEMAHYQTFGREPFGEAIGPHKSAATRPG